MASYSTQIRSSLARAASEYARTRTAYVFDARLQRSVMGLVDSGAAFDESRRQKAASPALWAAMGSLAGAEIVWGVPRFVAVLS